MKIKNTLLWITLFGIAMGLLETAVVVYLRELYYPEGFAFPLKMMSPQILGTELLREAATLIMLVSAGILAGRTATEKFGYFIYTFAIWDIFYYVFLKLLLGWPESLLTWDILFLIPTTWVGPVITPVLLSMAMAVFCLFIVWFTEHQKSVKIETKEWFLLILGSLVCIVSFTWEYSRYILEQFSWAELLVPSEDLMEYAIRFVPQQFPWFIFLLGFFIIISGITRFVIRYQFLIKKEV